MKKLLLILLTIFATVAFIQSSDALNVDYEEYIVKKGDTLWGISYAHYDDYFLWPRLWNFNPHITNPDFIYPGTLIRIPSRETLMTLPFIPKPVKKPKPSKPTVVFKHSGKYPEYLIDRELYIRSGWISKTYPVIGEISSSPTEREIVGNGDTVYLQFHEIEKPEKKAAGSQMSLTIKPQKSAKTEKYFSIRKVKTVLHPRTGKILGFQLRITGVMELSGKDNEVQKATITEAYEDIQIGDGLIPYAKMDPPYEKIPARTPAIEGYFIESQMNSRILGIGDIVYLDKGTDDGILVGDSFSAMSESKIKRTIGTIQIISVQPETSTALIRESQSEIIIGSEWGRKR